MGTVGNPMNLINIVIAENEEKMKVALNRLKKSPVFLDKLPKDAGRFEDENIECGTLCVMEEVYS